MTPDYESRALADFNHHLRDWANEDPSRMDRVDAAVQGAQIGATSDGANAFAILALEQDFVTTTVAAFRCRKRQTRPEHLYRRA